jgi:hypothetical protein
MQTEAVAPIPQTLAAASVSKFSIKRPINMKKKLMAASILIALKVSNFLMW